LSNGFEDRRANPSHSQAITIQCPCQESNLIFDLRRVACASTTPHRHFFTQWCRRDSNPQTLVPKTSRSAVGVPHRIKQRRYRDSNSLSACFADTPRTKRISATFSSPGRTRTAGTDAQRWSRLFVKQKPSPLGHGTICFNQGGRPGTRTPKRD
jgi:hypothetical protein